MVDKNKVRLTCRMSMRASQAHLCPVFAKSMSLNLSTHQGCTGFETAHRMYCPDQARQPWLLQHIINPLQHLHLPQVFVRNE